jgi:hypothetical protein
LSFHFLLLVLLFAFTIAYVLAMKVASNRIDHRTAPIFISAWALLGLAVTWPFLGAGLWKSGAPLLMAQPWLVALAAIKGALMYSRSIRGQQLTQASLSSSNYVRPMSIGMIAIVNFMLGEKLTHAQWASSLGLCLVSVVFFFKGHLSEFTRREKIYYADLVGFNVTLAAIDFAVIKGSNWFCDLVIGNVVLLVVGLACNRRAPEVLKVAFFSGPAIVAGFLFSATEQLKFYQQVTINPISMVLTVQALSQPIIMVLSAHIWKERTMREQLIWGMAAFALVTLPFLIGL